MITRYATVPRLHHAIHATDRSAWRKAITWNPAQTTPSNRAAGIEPNRSLRGSRA